MILGITYFISPEAYLTHDKTLGQLGIQARKDWMEDSEAFILGNQSPEKGKLAPLEEDQVAERGGQIYLTGTDIELTVQAEKMSKARGNVINPDKVVEKNAANTMRLYEMFLR